MYETENKSLHSWLGFCTLQSKAGLSFTPDIKEFVCLLAVFVQTRKLHMQKLQFESKELELQ